MHQFLKFRHLRACTLSLSACALLVACESVRGPSYERPQDPISENSTWNKSTDLPVAGEVVQPEWWSGFGDPVLDSLISEALADSYDLRILAARVNEAEAQSGLTKADRLPTLGGTGGASVTARGTRDGSPKTDQNFELGTSLNWELDIWGKKKREILASNSKIRATEADYRAGYLSLVTSIATNYFTLRQFDKQIETQRRAKQDAEIALDIYQAQFQEGVVSYEKVSQQMAEVASRKRDLADRTRQRELAELTLATLLGKPAGSIRVKMNDSFLRLQPLEIPANLPSDLIWRRPDILAAEYRVLEAHYKIESANLARLPTISLTANGGVANRALSSLFQTWTAGLTPTLNIPLFDPKIGANIRITKAEYATLSEQYIKQILTALEEVEKSLVNIRYYRVQFEASNQKTRNSLLAKSDTEARLAEGLVSQLEVFEAQRTFVEAEEELYTDLRNLLLATVELYKALGGGWEETPVRYSAN